MGDSAGSGVGSFVALEVGTSADVGAGLVEFVTFLASVQKVVGSFKKWNSDGSSGVDPLANTTISISPAVCLLTCPSAEFSFGSVKSTIRKSVKFILISINT